MTEEEILRKQGEHLAGVLSAVDGEGKRFEFQTLYYYLYTVSQKKKIDGEEITIPVTKMGTVQTVYTCLALSRVSNNSPVLYKTEDGYKIEVNKMFREPQKCVETALLKLEEQKVQTLEQIQSKILDTLSRFSGEIKYYDEMAERIKAVIDKGV